MLFGTQALLVNKPMALNLFKEEHVTSSLAIYTSLTVMLLAVATLTPCLKGGRTIVVGLLKGSLIMSGLNPFSLLPDLSVMVAPFVTVPIFLNCELGHSALNVVLSLILSKF